MAITYVGSATATTSTTTTTVDLTAISGLDDGDVLVAFGNTSGTWEDPAGPPRWMAETLVHNIAKVWVWDPVLSGVVGSSASFVTTGNASTRVTVVAYRGCLAPSSATAWADSYSGTDYSIQFPDMAVTDGDWLLCGISPSVTGTSSNENWTWNVAGQGTRSLRQGGGLGTREIIIQDRPVTSTDTADNPTGSFTLSAAGTAGGFRLHLRVGTPPPGTRFVSTGGCQTDGTSLTVTGCGLAAVDDLLMLAVYHKANAAISTPSGWTAGLFAVTTASGYLSVFYRWVTSAGTQDDVSFTGLTSSSAGSMACFRGVNKTASWNDSFVQHSGGFRNKWTTYDSEDLTPGVNYASTGYWAREASDGIMAVYVQATQNDVTVADWWGERTDGGGWPSSGGNLGEIADGYTTTGTDCGLAWAFHPSSMDDDTQNVSGFRCTLTEQSAGSSLSASLMFMLAPAEMAVTVDGTRATTTTLSGGTVHIGYASGTRATTAALATTAAGVRPVDGARPVTVTLAADISVSAPPVDVDGARPTTVTLSATGLWVRPVDGAAPVTAALSAAAVADRPVAGTLPATVGLVSAVAVTRPVDGTRPTDVSGTAAAVVGRPVDGALPVTAGLAGAGRTDPGVTGTAPVVAAVAGLVVLLLPASATSPVTAGVTSTAVGVRPADGAQPVTATLAAGIDVTTGGVQVDVDGTHASTASAYASAYTTLEVGGSGPVTADLVAAAVPETSVGGTHTTTAAPTGAATADVAVAAAHTTIGTGTAAGQVDVAVAAASPVTATVAGDVTVVGVVDVTGTLGVTAGLAAAAVPDVTATGTLGVTGTLTGTGGLAADVAGAHTTTGTLTAAGSVDLTGGGSRDVTATVSGATTLTANATGSHGTGAGATADATVEGTVDVTGAQPVTAALASAATADHAVAGTLDASVGLAADGSVTEAVDVDGSLTVTTGLESTITRPRDVDGSHTSTVGFDPVVAGVRPVDGAVDVAAALAATAAPDIVVDAPAPVTAGLAAVLAFTPGLVGADLPVTAGLAAAIDSTLPVGGSVAATSGMLGIADVVAHTPLIQGQHDTAAALAGTANTVGVADADVDVTAGLAAAIDVTGWVDIDGARPTGTTLAGSAVRDVPAAGTAPVTATLAGVTAVTRPTGADLPVTGGLAGQAARTVDAAGAVPAVGDVSGTAAVDVPTGGSSPTTVTAAATAVPDVTVAADRPVTAGPEASAAVTVPARTDAIIVGAARTGTVTPAHPADGTRATTVTLTCAAEVTRTEVNADASLAPAVARTATVMAAPGVDGAVQVGAGLTGDTVRAWAAAAEAAATAAVAATLAGEWPTGGTRPTTVGLAATAHVQGPYVAGRTAVQVRPVPARPKVTGGVDVQVGVGP